MLHHAVRFRGAGLFGFNRHSFDPVQLCLGSIASLGIDVLQT